MKTIQGGRLIFNGILNAVCLAFLLTLSHSILKWASQKGGADVAFLRLMVTNWWQIGLAMGLYVFIFLYYTHALRTMHISFLYPVYTGLSIVLVFLVGTLFFNEPVSLRQIVGIVLILVGIGFFYNGAGI